MAQLSGLDNFTLYDEQGNVYNHVAALGIYDPSTSPSGMTRFKDILHHFKRRMGDFPIFRRKLVTVPYGIDRPYWAEAGEIDAEFHIRHIALPHPGDWRQLMIQTARLHSRPLDRTRPLWEIYVIEGLGNIPGLHPGCFALFLKFHHAAVDGQSGIALLEAVHAITADESPNAPSHYSLPATNRGPNTLEMLANVAKNTVSRSLGLSSLYVSTASKVGALIWERLPKPFAAEESARKLPVKAAALTRFNHPVSANRVVDAVHFPLSDIKVIRQGIPGCTIDDVFLAVCGGALRRYLNSKGELPDESLRALVPKAVNEKIITKRKLHSTNEIGGTPVALRTDIQDPVERLHAVRAEIQNAKHTAEGLGLNLFQDLLDNLPEAAGRALLRHALLPLLNVSASNVRGPEVPLYVAGARLMHFYPVGIATDFVGLNLSGFSYNGVLWISAVACRNMMPDPGFFAECLRHSFNDLLEAAKFMSAVRTAGSTSNVYALGAVAGKNKGKSKPLPSKPLPARSRTAGSNTKSASKTTRATVASKTATATPKPAITKNKAATDTLK